MVRRGSETRATILRVTDVALDPATRVARRSGRQIELTNREFRLLDHLRRSAGRVCSRMMILEKVWEDSFDPGAKSETEIHPEFTVDLYCHAELTLIYLVRIANGSGIQKRAGDSNRTKRRTVPCFEARGVDEVPSTRWNR